MYQVLLVMSESDSVSFQSKNSESNSVSDWEISSWDVNVSQ